MPKNAASNVKLRLIVSVVLLFTTFTSKAETIPNQLPLVLESGWSFQSSSSDKAKPIKIGSYLERQIEENKRDGQYRIEADIGFVKKLNESTQKNLSLLLPATGGLISVQVNEVLTILPRADYSSIGPIISIPESALEKGRIDIRINIQTLSNSFTGMWKNAPIIDTTPNLIIERDKSYIYQKITPTFFAIIFFLFGLIFLWFQYKSKIKSPIYTEYILGFLTAAVHFTFLSGTIRTIFPFFGAALHYPSATLSWTISFRIIAVLGKINVQTINRITKILLFFITMQVGFQLTNTFPQFNIFTYYSIGLASIFALYRLKESISTKEGYIFLFVSSLFVCTNIIDSTHLMFNFLVKPFPLVFLNRITSPPFLFMSIMYLGNHLLEEITRSQKDKIIAEVSTQVSHDIRSPLAALEAISSSLDELSDPKRRIIRNSINRIRDISNSLLEKNKITATNNEKVDTNPNELSIVLLTQVIDSIITEKRTHYKNFPDIEITFDKKDYGLFGSIKVLEFQRMISNLIDNAIESIESGKGRVELTLKINQSNDIELLIKDNGKGIPENIIPTLGNRGKTFDKKNGSGLGLYHAKKTMQEIEGTLNFKSKTNHGTSVTLTIPSAKPPNWFVPKLLLNTNQAVITFDDDQSIQKMWEDRFLPFTMEGIINLYQHNDSAEFKKFYRKNFAELEDALYLMDYSISEDGDSGLDIIETIGIQNQSILVTSHDEDEHIRLRCGQLGVRIIPKGLCAIVPIEIKRP